LRLCQTLFPKHSFGVGGGPSPNGPVTFGDAGIRATGRLAQGNQWRLRVHRRCLLKTQRGRRIEEAVGQDTNMQRAGKTGEQRAHPATTGSIFLAVSP